MRVVVERDLRVTVAHELRYDVSGRSGFKQACCDTVSEAVDTDVNSLRGLDSQPAHRAMNAVPNDVVRQIRSAIGIGEQVALRIGAVIFFDPIVEVSFEQL